MDVIIDAKIAIFMEEEVEQNNKEHQNNRSKINEGFRVAEYVILCDGNKE